MGEAKKETKMTRPDRGLIFHFSAIIFWILNAAHILFTVWAVMVNGELEMAVLFPLFFIQLPATIPFLVTFVAALLIRGERKDKASAFVPIILFLIQLSVFWLKIYGIF